MTTGLTPQMVLDANTEVTSPNVVSFFKGDPVSLWRLSAACRKNLKGADADQPAWQSLPLRSE
jgi:hypothetical protein